MPVSKTFKRSKMNQIINFLLEKYGVEGDYDQIIQEALDLNLIKSAKESSNTTTDKPNKSPKKSGITRWTAFQKWIKLFQIIEGYKLDRNTIKELWTSQYINQDLWTTVAEQLEKGVDIRDCDKPDIKEPYLDFIEARSKCEASEDEASTDVEVEVEKVEEPVEEHVEEPIEEEKVEAEEKEVVAAEKVEDEFNQIDTNGDGVISREEFEVHKVEQKEELESRLAAAVASADYQLAGEIQKSIANLG
jgi:hypothetical protein